MSICNAVCAGECAGCAMHNIAKQDMQCMILQGTECTEQSAPTTLSLPVCQYLVQGGTPHQCRAQPVKLSLSNCFCIGRQFPSGTNCPHILGIKLHKNNKGPKNRILTRPSSVCASHSETKRHRTKKTQKTGEKNPAKNDNIMGINGLRAPRCWIFFA